MAQINTQPIGRGYPYDQFHVGARLVDFGRKFRIQVYQADRVVCEREVTARMRSVDFNHCAEALLRGVVDAYNDFPDNDNAINLNAMQVVKVGKRYWTIAESCK